MQVVLPSAKNISYFSFGAIVNQLLSIREFLVICKFLHLNMFHAITGF